MQNPEKTRDCSRMTHKSAPEKQISKKTHKDKQL